ncbi:MAG: hypothetical protein ACQSGP_09600 [Frankia sp.]
MYREHPHTARGAADQDGVARFGARRQTVIAANPELREREALKGLGLTASMIDALKRRGVPDLTSRVAAGLGALAWKIAFERWSETTNDDEFGDVARRTLSEVQAASAHVLTADKPPHTRPVHPDRCSSRKRTVVLAGLAPRGHTFRERLQRWVLETGHRDGVSVAASAGLGVLSRVEPGEHGEYPAVVVGFG